MINEKIAKSFCKEDISKIKNYELAITDTTQTWVCHHILGEILTRQKLLEHDFYYDVPACMLKFVTRAEHVRLHMKGKTLSEETRRKISEAHKGNHLSKETRNKISEAHKGKSSPRKGVTLSDETRRKISEAKKGKTWKFINGKRVLIPKEGNV